MLETPQYFLSTWFFKFLQEEKPSGLPNEFLTNAPQAILLFDEIVCDEDGFEAEMYFADRWLGSRIFKTLKEEGVLKPESYRARLQPFFQDLETSGLRTSVEKRIQSDRNKSVQIRLSMLKAFDSLCLAYLSRPHFLTYDWRGGLLRQIRVNRLASEDIMAQLQLVSPGISEEMGRMQPSIHSLVKLLCPAITLLPGKEYVRAVDPEAVELWEENIKREKLGLVNFMLQEGGWTLDRCREFRTSKVFEHGDKRFDKAREKAAMNNLEKILRVRQDTKDVRKTIAEYIGRFVSGGLTHKDIEKELQLELSSWATRFGYPNESIGATVTKTTATCVLSLIKPWAAVVFSASDLINTWLNRNKFKSMRSEYPLAWLRIAASRRFGESQK